ncbi:MAG: heat shock protein HspQ [Wenzhouxiangella sp.]|jgi:heat shock protein HspQ|nr:heat shock protein HspQ [Wenzhouxiangella sp.]
MSDAKFSPGQLIHHLKYDYRGVIVDVDAEFSGSEEWYEQVAVSRPPKDRPWYHVLVHGAEHMTYVAEQHLEGDASTEQIEHPALGQFFDTFIAGRYKRSVH